MLRRVASGFVANYCSRCSWLILVTLMMEALLSSETSALIRASRRNIPEDVVLILISSSQLDLDSEMEMSVRLRA
jgi:predicted Rdx family selenoprotein